MLARVPMGYLPAALLLLGGTRPPGPPELSVARPNDNRVPAGQLQRGRLELALETRRVAWHVTGDANPAGEVLAFAEAGKAAEIPGPLIRVTVGTNVTIKVTNSTDSTLVLHVLSDSAIIAPGQSGGLSLRADSPGTFFYWASTTRSDLRHRAFEDSQLHGALVIDQRGARVSADRVFVISEWVQRRRPDGAPALPSALLAINGRAWPETEPLHYALGDSVRWRLINTSVEPHPMHLHGFYFRIDARGDVTGDTLLAPARRRMAVTEVVYPGQTMAMVWSPNRPGTWLFHCHFAIHTLPNVPIRTNPAAPSTPPAPGAVPFIFRDALAGHDPSQHVREGMGGLMLAITVAAPSGWSLKEPARRSLRLLVQHNGKAGVAARYGFLLPAGPVEPARDSVERPAPTLVLRRGEPTSIMVVNRADTPTQIHWHGLEIENYYDGVTGVGGYPGMQTPAILPGDSFEVRLTPPRAGSFMYHSHLDDARQMLLGLWGAIVVLDADQAWNPELDRVFLVSIDAAQAVLNGVAVPDTLVLSSGASYRFRLMNLSIAGIYRVGLLRDSLPVQWTPLAKDGFALSGAAAAPVAARLTSAVGETYDVEFRPEAPGILRLEYRTGSNNNLVISQVMRVIASAPARP